MIFLFKYATFRFHRLVFWNSTRIQFWFPPSPPAVQETASRVPFSTCRLSKTSKRPQGSKAGPATSENSKTWKNVGNYPKGCNFSPKMKAELFLKFNNYRYIYLSPFFESSNLLTTFSGSAIVAQWLSRQWKSMEITSTLDIFVCVCTNKQQNPCSTNHLPQGPMATREKPSSLSPLLRKMLSFPSSFPSSL